MPNQNWFRFLRTPVSQRRVSGVLVSLAVLVGAAAFLLPKSCAQSTRVGVRERAAGAGLSYFNEIVADEPWSIQVVKIDRAQKDLVFLPTLARGSVVGLSTLSEQLARIPRELGTPVAAVNGDFYQTENETIPGDPRGLEIIQGELVSGPTGVSFWVDTNGLPHIDTVTPQFKVTWPDGSSASFGLNEERSHNAIVLYTPKFAASTRVRGGVEIILERDGEKPWLPLQAGRNYAARVREARNAGNSPIQKNTLVLSVGPGEARDLPKISPGDVLQISTATKPDLSTAQSAIGGGPVLVRGGKVQSTRTNKADQRHPRTAIGFNEKHIFLVQVDGRQGHSVGINLPELANYMARIGVTEGMNLDGGGSSTIWLNGRVVNSPCYGHERPIANSLVVLRKPQPASEAD